MNDLTENEKLIFKDFLSKYAEVMSNGCNDLKLENTKENRDLVKAAFLWNVGNDEKVFQKEYGNDFFLDEEDDIIYVLDYVIFGYLCSKMGFKSI
jgi:hypothetical protein